MTNIVVCDDTDIDLTIIREMMGKYLDKKKQNIRIIYCENACEILEKYSGADIYLLDVCMPGISGIELAKQLKKKNPKAIIAFITADANYAHEAYQVGALQVLVKPVWEKRLENMVDRLLALLKKEVVYAKLDVGEKRILCSELKYVNVEDRKLKYHLDGGDCIVGAGVRGKMREAVPEIANHEMFFMVGAAVAVNLAHIEELQEGKIVFYDGEELYYARNRYQELRQEWIHLWDADWIGNTRINTWQQNAKEKDGSK